VSFVVLHAFLLGYSESMTMSSCTTMANIVHLLIEAVECYTRTDVLQGQEWFPSSLNLNPIRDCMAQFIMAYVSGVFIR